MRRRALVALSLLGAVTCTQPSLGRLRSLPDAGGNDGDGATTPASRLPALECGAGLSSTPDEVVEVGSELVPSLVDDHEVAEVSRWEGGDSFADAEESTLLLPGGRCPGGVSLRGFRDRSRAGVPSSGEGCVAGLDALDGIELGYNGNIPGACLHGSAGGVRVGRVLRLLDAFWQPSAVLPLPDGESRCVFGRQLSAVVFVDAAGRRGVMGLDEAYRRRGEGVALAPLAAPFVPRALVGSVSDRWALWNDAQGTWAAERLADDGSVQSLQFVDPLRGLGPDQVLEVRSRPPGLLALVSGSRGVEAALVCADEAPHSRLLLAGSARAARLVRRGPGHAIFWQEDVTPQRSRIWAVEFDQALIARARPRLLVEGDALRLVDVTWISGDADRLVLWYGHGRPEGSLVLRTARVVFNVQ